MSPSPRHPAPHVGRFTAVILGFVVIVCVAMIGGTGYLKYQMDRAETLLTTPDVATGSTQDTVDRLRRVLGYGGFLGLAQNYVIRHDDSGFGEMKADIKAADEIVAHLPDHTPAEMRHDLTAIVTTFDTALQQLNAPANGSEFTVTDLMPLYAALPVLDSRIAATSGETRLDAENQMHFWGMLLTLVSWCSLIIASACAAGIYLAIRDKHSAPMRALAQSIQNMARGDMRTAIWGTERQDQIGELARAVDSARYHFSHLPDLSLLSDQGPVRMRFEGGTRSLFEAMMKAISGDSETIRGVTASLTQEVEAQREAVAGLSAKVEAVLQNILKHGQDGDKQITRAISEMVTSVEGLKNAHGHAADQLNRIIPPIQERALGLAEITQMTGKQAALALQSLTLSEMSMKTNVEQARETLAKLSSTADSLGERLFGAINLLQASGKVLAETTENMQQVIGGNGGAGASSEPLLLPQFERLIAERVEPKFALLEQSIGQAIGEHIAAMPVPVAAVAAPVEVSGGAEVAALAAQIDTLRGTLAQQAQTVIDNVAAASALASNTMIELNDRLAGLAGSLPVQLRQQMEEEMGRLAAQIDGMRAAVGEAVAVRIEPGLAAVAQQLGEWTREIIDQAAATSAQTRGDIALLQGNVNATGEMLRSSLAALDKPPALPAEFMKQMSDHWYQMAAQIEASRNSLEKALQEKVAGRLGSFEDILASVRGMVEGLREDAAKPSRATFSLPPELQKQMSDQWFQVAAQIEASRASLVESISDQIEKMEGRMAGRSQPTLSRTAADYATQRQIEQQTQILSELVGTLAALDAHMQQIQSEMRVVGK